MPIEAVLVRSFLAVAEEKSFSGAARRLGLQQPHVSQRVRKLEGQLGFAVLARTPHGAELTRGGEEFLPFARNIVSSVEDAQKFAQAFRGDDRVHLRLGTLDHAGPSVRDDIVKAYIDANPECDFDISVAQSPDLYEKLRSGRLDVILLLANPQRVPSGLRMKPLLNMIGDLLIPEESLLARYPVIPLEALRGESILLSPGTTCPDVVDDLDKQLRSLGIVTRHSPEANRRTLVHLARVKNMPLFGWRGSHEDIIRAPKGFLARRVAGDPFRVSFSAAHIEGREIRTVKAFLKLAGSVAATAQLRSYAAA
ncbi:MAG: LysR family transcriptional regulator [Caulobacterales bacterium]